MGKQRTFISLLCVLVACRSFAQDIVPADTSVTTKNKSLVFPFFLKSPETHWGFGGIGAYFFKAKKTDKEIRTSDVNLITLYTLRKQVVGVLSATIFFPEEKHLFRFQISYSHYPDKTWGIGNHSLPGSQEEYSIKQLYFNPQLLEKIWGNWYTGITYEFQNIHDFVYAPNGVFVQQAIPGRYGGNVSGLGLLILYDTRNSAYSPSQGFFAEMNETVYDRIIGSAFNFTTLSLDVRRFISLTRNNHRILALQLILKNNSGTVPIRNLALLGGPEMMRGYYKGRFTEKDLVAVQAEVRQFLFWRLGITAFAAAGQVNQYFRDFNFEGFHYAYGGGLRLLVNEKEKLNFRVDFGFGRDSNGIYVILKEAF